MLYLIHGNQHSQHLKIYKNQKLEKKKEGNTEDSRLKRQRNQLDKYKSLKKNEKGVQKKKLIDTKGESNINTVAEELVLILLLSLMKYTISLFPTNCQTT